MSRSSIFILGDSPLGRIVYPYIDESLSEIGNEPFLVADVQEDRLLLLSLRDSSYRFVTMDETLFQDDDPTLELFVQHLPLVRYLRYVYPLASVWTMEKFSSVQPSDEVLAEPW